MRSSFLLAVKDSTLEEDKKCKIENEIQALMKALEHETPDLTNPGKEVDDNLLKHKLGKSHSNLPFLSVDVDIEFEPTRGRFAVANK